MIELHYVELDLIFLSLFFYVMLSEGLRSHTIGIACNTNWVVDQSQSFNKKLLKNSKSKKWKICEKKKRIAPI